MTGSDSRIPSDTSRQPISTDAIRYTDLVKCELIGTGGTADVYRATVEGDGGVIALKELRTEPTGGEVASEDLADQFETEAEIWAGLDDHEHIVDVVAWDTDPQPWLALEFMDSSLRHRLDRDTVDIPEALWIAVCVARAVRYAHRHGVAHLDLKPENVLVQRTADGVWDVPKVADWGLAKLLLNDSPSRKSFTPKYAPPELHDPDRFGQPDERVDIFQLGVIVYELLAGEAPFDGSHRQAPERIVSENPQAITRHTTDAPALADDVVQRALAKHVDKRYASIIDFERDLERLLAEVSAYEPQAIDTTHQPIAIESPLPTRGGRLHPTLRSQGFQLIDDLYLLTRTPKSFADALRTGMRPVEAKSDIGYVLDREHEDEEAGERVNVTTELLAELDTGASRIVVGSGGSGKSAICLSVVRDWLETDRGPVLYRRSGQPTFEDTARLRDRIRTTDGHVLVVVEDAMRAEAADVYDVIDAFRDDSSVSFLLDARKNEYESADPVDRETSVAGARRDVHYRQIEPVYVPPLDQRECERFIRHAERYFDVPIEIDAETLYDRVTTSGTTNQLLTLTYHLLGAADGRNPLQDDVIDKYETIDTPDPNGHHAALATVDDELRRHGGMLIAMLVAIDEFPPQQEYVYALREILPSSPSFLDINRLLTDGFDTWLVDIRSDDWHIQGMHEVWAVRYLRYAVTAQQRPGGQQRTPRLGKQVQIHRRFVNCLEAVLTVHRDEGFRQELGEFWGRQKTVDERVADATLETILRNVFRLGERYEGLTPLFEPVADGKSRGSLEPTELDDISSRTAARLLAMLGRMHSLRGNTAQARDRFRDARDMWYEDGNPGGYADNIRWIGRTYRLEGEYEAARDRFRKALRIYREYDIDEGRADAIEALGTVARLRANHEDALAYFERAQEISKTTWRKKSLTTVRGIVYHDQGRYEEAHGLYEEALELSREIGDRIGEGYALNNIGRVARHWDLATAEHRSKQAFTIFDEIGHEVGAAQALNNLAKAALVRDRIETASDYAHRAFARSDGVDTREAARSRHTMARVHLQAGRLAEARTEFQAAMATFEQLDDNWSEARSRLYLGQVYDRQDEVERAIECFETAAETFAECDAEAKVLKCYRQLVTVHADRENPDQAREYCIKAGELIAQSEQSFEEDYEWFKRQMRNL